MGQGTHKFYFVRQPNCELYYFTIFSVECECNRMEWRPRVSAKISGSVVVLPFIIAFVKSSDSDLTILESERKSLAAQFSRYTIYSSLTNYARNCCVWNNKNRIKLMKRNKYDEIIMISIFCAQPANQQIYKPDYELRHRRSVFDSMVKRNKSICKTIWVEVKTLE